MTETIFIQRLESGYSNVHKLESSIMSYPPGKNLIITISDRSRRSDKQNNLWWEYMTILSKHTGFTKEEMHEVAKFMFLKKEAVNEQTGEVYSYVGSTTKLTKEEFSELIEKLFKWASETLTITLPSPEDQMGIFD
jgi:hypothetical protein